jgi:hypothetical protein
LRIRTNAQYTKKANAPVAAERHARAGHAIISPHGRIRCQKCHTVGRNPILLALPQSNAEYFEYHGEMLMAITAAQLQDVVSLSDRLSQARRATGHAQSPDEVLRDPVRWELTDYLYSLSDEARRDLILLMLVGRGDVKHASERAAEACLKYRSADDQVAYLMSKSVRLAEYLKIGMLALVAIIHRQHDAPRAKTLASRRR